MGIKSLILIVLVYMNTLCLENAYYADDFMNMEWGARPSALGNVNACVSGKVSATYYNPAGLSFVNGKQALVMHSSKFRSEVKADLFAAALQLKPDVGLGLGYSRTGVVNIKDTRNLDIDAKGIPVFDKSKISYLSNLDHILFIGIGKTYRDKLALGVTAKVFYRILGDITGYGLSCDLGGYWKISRNVSVDVSIKNATTAYTAWSTGVRETAYPTAVFGVSYSRSVPYFYGAVSAYCQTASLYSFNAVNNRNSVTPSSLRGYEDFTGWAKSGQGGLEYTFKDMLSLRAGISPVYKFTSGAGLVLKKDLLKNSALRRFMDYTSLLEWRIDYAFLKSADLYESHLVSVSIGI